MISAATSGGFDLAALESAARTANRDVGRDLARVVKAETRVQLRAVRGSATMSGMRVRFGAKAKVYAGASTVTVSVEPNAPGPWSIIEHGTGAHVVRGRSKRAVTAPGGPFASVTVAGVRPRRYWTRTADAAEPAIADAVAAVFDDALDTG